MAKKGLLGKLVAAAAVGAAIGSACYIFRDKIRESALYTKLDVDKRLAQLKAIFKKEEEDFFEEDEYLFRDSDSSSDRTYVSLDTGSQEASGEDADTAKTTDKTENIDDFPGRNASLAEDTLTEDDSLEEDVPEDELASEDNSFEEDIPEEDELASEDDSFSEDVPEDEDLTAEKDLAEKDALTEEEFDTAPVQENSVPTIAIETIGDIYDAATQKTAASPFTSDDSDDTPSGYDMEGLSDVSEDPEVLIEQDMLDEASFGY